jgi:hypothetical protein
MESFAIISNYIILISFTLTLIAEILRKINVRLYFERSFVDEGWMMLASECTKQRVNHDEHALDVRLLELVYM